MLEFMLEFKMMQGDVQGSLDAAMAQMKDRGYADKYRERREPIHLIGLAFGEFDRNLVGVRTELVR